MDIWQYVSKMYLRDDVLFTFLELLVYNPVLTYVLCGKKAQNESLPLCLFFTTLLTVFQTSASSHFLDSSHHCLITQQPFPHSSMANHCSITTCLLLLSCHYGLLIAGQSTKKICHEKAVVAVLNGSATKMRKRKKKKFIIAIYYMTTMILNAPPVHSSESILL